MISWLVGVDYAVSAAIRTHIYDCTGWELVGGRVAYTRSLCLVFNGLVIGMRRQ